MATSVSKSTENLKEGNILISVHAKDNDEVSLAKDILKEHDASDICAAGMTEGVGEEADSDAEGRRAYRGSDGPKAVSSAYPADSHPRDGDTFEEGKVAAAPSHALRH